MLPTNKSLPVKRGPLAGRIIYWTNLKQFLLILPTLLLMCSSGCLFDKTPAGPTQSGGSELFEGEYPSISPDGGKIAFVRFNNIYACKIDGQAPIMLTTGSGPAYYPRWSKDGTHIAFIRMTDTLIPSLGTVSFNKLMQVEVTSKIQGDLSPADGPFGEPYRAYDFQWSPSGNIIECFCESTAVHFSKIFRTDDDRIVLGKYFAQEFNWSPDGNKFICSSDQYALPRHLYIGYIGADTLMQLPTRANPSSPHWFTDGIRIAYTTTDDGLLVYNTITMKDTLLVRYVAPTISISPNSKRIAYFQYYTPDNPDEGTTTYLYSLNVETGISTLLVSSSGAEIDLAWSASSQDVFYSFNGNIYEVHVQ